MNIDWDAALDDAATSPRALLSAELALIDEMRAVVVVTLGHDGEIRVGWSSQPAPFVGSLELLGLLTIAKDHVVGMKMVDEL